MTADSPRLETSKLAGRLTRAYYSALVAHYVAANPNSAIPCHPLSRKEGGPLGRIPRKDGTWHTLSLRHYLDAYISDLGIQEDALWDAPTGALLMLGNKLTEYSYFDRLPLLELVRHVRNGLAHGNSFDIRGDTIDRIHAHNRNAQVKSEKGTVFEVVKSDNDKPVLLDFMLAGDALDLLQSVAIAFRQ
jgi:hypothetical protein